MSYQLTLGDLRVQVGRNLGEPEPLGVVSNYPASGTAWQDISRFDDDNTFNGGWIQGYVTPSAVPFEPNNTQRILAWTQGNNTFTLYGPLASLPAPGPGTIYEVHQKLSFQQLRACVNNGIGWCGKYLRNQVRDETQAMQANQYQYTPNYSASATNAFWPGEVVRVDWEYWTGQGTREWIEMKDWYYLDDETLQFPTWVVDGWAPNPLRFTGYGPVTQRIVKDNWEQVIATFDDEFAANMLIWASTAAAWNMLGAQLQANEQSAAKANEQNALQQAQAARETWTRGRAQTGRTRTPMTVGGWSGT